MYALAAPLKASNGPPAATLVPWNQLVLPTGVLRFCNDQPFPARSVISLKSSVNACAETCAAPKRRAEASVADLRSVEIFIICFMSLLLLIFSLVPSPASKHHEAQYCFC